MNDWFSYLIIGGVFLSGMVPLVAGIVHYIKKNRQLDEDRPGKAKGDTFTLLTRLR